MNFVSVKLLSNVARKDLMVSNDTTVRKILTDNNVDYSRAGISLDTAPVSGPQLDMTLAELGYTGNTDRQIMLSCVVKADNA